MFYIGVKCTGGRCAFSIKPTFMKELELEDGLEL